MKTIEYNTTYAKEYSSESVGRILWKNPQAIEREPSLFILDVIKDSGWSTDWAFSHIPPDRTQPARYIVFPKLEKQLSAVEWVLRGQFKGKTVLDLGCGARSGTYESGRQSEPGKFEPWLARVLHNLGAQVIGIDVGDLKGEKFETHNIDLLNSEALDVFPTHSFDLVHSSGLYTSPELQLRVEGRAWDGSLKAAQRLVNVLKPQISRILKPGGYYLFREETDYLIENSVGNRGKVSPFEVFSSNVILED